MRARLLCVHTRTVGRTVQSHRAGSRVFARARVEHTGVHIPIIKESIYIHARTCVGVFVIGDRVYSHVARIYIYTVGEFISVVIAWTFLYIYARGVNCFVDQEF